MTSAAKSTPPRWLVASLVKQIAHRTRYEADASAPAGLTSRGRFVREDDCSFDDLLHRLSSTEEGTVYMANADYPPGTAVRLIARPEVAGVVTGFRDIAGSRRFDVFHDGTVHGYFDSQIETIERTDRPVAVSAAAFRAGLTSALLRSKDAGYLHTRNVGRIEYEPYQFRPVLKIVQADRPRVLVADDVGVGKTIEACLVLKELQARQRARTVLIICPKPLVVDHKWRNELKRFDEEFVHLDTDSLRFCLDETLREGEWPARYAKAIVPYSLLDERLLIGGEAKSGAPRVGLADLAPGPHFDLVVIDEAHHIRNRSTFAYRNVHRLTESADAVVMLSATPLQTDSSDLYTLVHLLRDDLVPTERDFAQMLEPNQFLFEASEAARAGLRGWQGDVREALASALATAWGRQVMAVDPLVAQLRELLQADRDDSHARLRAVRTIEDLNTFSAIVSRTRRRDIGAFTTRKPSAPLVDFTPDQAAIYDAVISLGRRLVELQAPGMPAEFLLSMLRRQAASSISGLAPLVTELLDGRLDNIEFSEVGADSDTLVPAFSSELRKEISEVGILAARLEHQPDPKIEILQRIVGDKQADENNKVLVFSTFRHTLRYLEERSGDWGVRVAVVHGAISDDERHSLRRRFKLPRHNPDAIDVMLCSEVGTEGLDYQFCNTLVNYDIPWNPMRIEQRIGRIDRRGQESESVAIINILTAGTIEAEIYNRCLLRVGVFHRALGGSEQILGELTTKLRKIADDLSLTAADRENRLRQLADNEVARVYELERLEDQQGALLGLTTESFESRVDEASSVWLEDGRICDLLGQYLDSLLPHRRIMLKPNKISVLRLDENAASQLASDLKTAVGGDARIERTLRQIPATIRVSTDATLAEDNEVELVSATHPLVSVAASHAAFTTLSTASLRVRSDLVAPGIYPIAVHSWTRIDTRDTLTLRYISLDPDVETAADRLLASAVDGDPDTTVGPAESDLLEQRHFAEWESARAKHISRSSAAGAQRVASLQAQQDRQVHFLEEAMGVVQDPKILKMRRSELVSVRAKFDRLIEQQRRAESRADLLSHHIATAILEVIAP
ncbi:MAG: helicase [Comamonadaceae bacterium]|nr:MAG: helicase [Comamonadaceae bacterium]